MSPGRTLAVAAALLLGHAGMLRLAAEWSFVAALLAPGAHSGLPALVFGLGFLATRLLVYVALPSVVAATAAFHAVSWGRRYFSRGQTSPTRQAGPMLSGPRGASAEVTDGDAR